MAMIDYGAVVFKNGVCQNAGEFFMDMEKSVGWSDKSGGAYQGTDGNFFAYVGDEHLTLAVYKYFCRVISDKEIVTEIWGTSHHTFTDLPEGKHKSLRFSVKETNFCLRQVGCDSRVYWLQFTYRGDHYNVVYGYGIDTNFMVWDKVKVRYLGKRTSKKVDALYRRFQQR